ncbi:MAG: hypothetical protein IJI36_04770 [Kiritimatiellae bacterium]|nr:hypothetical protein [Kiritimatiellia bacterium]
MKKTVKIVWMTAVAAGAAFTAEGVDAFSYVQKGLAACYDGIENAGAGTHDPNATTWVDLTGNGNDGAVEDGIAWAANGWVNSSAAAVAKPISVGPGLAATTGSETFTMEFTGTRSTAARSTLFGQYAYKPSVNFEYTANGAGATANSLRLHFYVSLAESNTLNQYTTQATTFRVGDSATLAFTAAPTERGLWKDGVRGTFTDNTRSADRILYRNTTCDSVIGGDAARDGDLQFPFIGTCNAFRLYNRVLTTEELAVNTAVDAVRFRGADPESLTLPAGWAFDAQGNLLKTVTVSAIGGTVCLGDGPAAATVTTNLVQDASSVTLTFTATADAGHEFVGWEGNTDAIISSDGMGVTVDCSGPVSLYAVFRSTGGVSPTFTAQGQYATDGLVAWFDGYENAGFGQHSTTANTWKDLSGNGNDASVDTTLVGWGETCYTNIATSGHPVTITPAGITPTILATDWTAEFATRTIDASGTRSSYFGNYKSTGLSIERQNGKLRLWYANAPNLPNIVAHAQNEATVFSALCAPTTQTVYKDGKFLWSVVTNLTAVNKLNTGLTYCIGGENDRANMMFRGNYYSFRLYDHPLSGGEVRINAAADAARLMRKVPATAWIGTSSADWLDGANWSGGVPSMQAAAFVAPAAGNLDLVLPRLVPALTNLTLRNAAGTTRVTVPTGGTVLSRNGVLTVGRGGEFVVSDGATVAFDGTGGTRGADAYTIDVTEGGKFILNGGTVTLDPFRGAFRMSGFEGCTGCLSIASGKLSINSVASAHGIQAEKGGRIEMTGGTISVTAPTYAPASTMPRFTFLDGGSIDMSGSAEIKLENVGGIFGAGDVRLSDSSKITIAPTWTPLEGWAYLYFFPNKGETCHVTVNDNASIALSERNTYVMLGDADHGGRTVLNWNSSKTIIAYNSFAVGMGNGCGELNLAAGTVNGRGRGLKIGENGITARALLFPTGVVNVTGGRLLNSNNTNGGDTMHGLVVGAGNCTSLVKPGLFRGILNVQGGAVTNTGHYFGVGLGVGEGDVTQTGGTIYHKPSSGHQMIVGAWGGTGRYVVSNGMTTATSDVYVGGITTNLLPHKPVSLYTVCPVTNHCAKGLLRVAGGSFATEGTLWLSQDGEGVLEIGPSGAVTAANVTLTNTPAALTGDADLAAKVRFAFGPQGVGTLTAAGALTIGPGATLEVDATALEKDGRYPLIAYGTCAGDFTSVTVTGRGTVVKTPDGYLLDRASGTVLLFR